MGKTISMGSVSLIDMNDIKASNVAPAKPETGVLWLDTSVNILKRWDGVNWVNQQMELKNLDPELAVVIENAVASLGTIANDNLIDLQERQQLKDDLSNIIGKVMGNAEKVLPTPAQLDVAVKGSFYSVRKSALNAGIQTGNQAYINVATQYQNLKVYLEGLGIIGDNVFPWDTNISNSKKNISVVKDAFRDKWLQYFLASETLNLATTLKLREDAEATKDELNKLDVGIREWTRNGNFAQPLEESAWKSNYQGVVKERVDISTETPPHKYALHIKNTTAVNGGIYDSVIWEGEEANSLVGKDVMLSAWVKHSAVTTGGGYGLALRLMITGQKPDGTFVNNYPKAWSVTGTSTVWEKVSGKVSISLPAGTAKLTRVQFRLGMQTATGEFWATGVSAKIGNRLTDWSENPLDMDARVSEVKTRLIITEEEIGLKAEKTLVDSIKGTVNTHTNQISANSTAISARLTSAQVDTLINGKGYATTTALNATSSSLSASIVEVSTDLSNLEIGGRNLLLDTNFNNGLNKWSVEGTVVGSIDVDNKYKGNNSAKLVFSAVDSNGTINRLFQYNGGMEQEPVRMQIAYGAYVKANKILRVGVRIAGLVDWFDVGTEWVYISGVGVGDKFLIFPDRTAIIWVNQPKTEKGNKATDWSPAPEDMATLERAVQIEANLNGLQTTVSAKADKTQITQLAGQISTKVESATYNSKMTQLDSSINLRVTAGQVSESILADNTIKDTRETNESPSWYNDNYPKQSIEEFKRRTVMGVSGSATYGRLETKIPWTDRAGGVITQVFYSSDGEFSRTSNSTYTAWLEWTRTADVENLVAQINLSPKGVLIQGKNIQLDGDVSMDNAFVNSIKAIDISADKITAGIIKGTNLSINLGTGDVVFQKGLIKRYDGLFNLDITKGRMESYSSTGGITLQDGELQLWKNPKYQFETQPTADNYGTLSYATSWLGAFNGMGLSIEGTDGVVIRTKNYKQGTMGGGAGAGVILGESQLRVETGGKLTLRGGDIINRGLLFDIQPSIEVGVRKPDTSQKGKDIVITADQLYIKAINSYDMSMANGLEVLHLGHRTFLFGGHRDKPVFELGGSSFSQVYDSAGAYLRSTTLADRTSSAGANVYVRADGVMYRTTSASKYKLNISEIPDVEDYSRKILELKPKQWFDKSAVEGRVLEINSKGKETRVDSSAITPYYGLIAEDLVDLGLTKYVQYGADGKEVEGIMYDRLWTLLIPIVKEHDLQLAEQDSQIAKLNTKLTDQSKMINQLFAEINKLKGDM